MKTSLVSDEENNNGNVIEILETPTFGKWFAKLKVKDKVTHFKITERLLRLANGHYGDRKTIRGYENLFELRIFGQAYRIYFTHQSDVIVLLLVGGDKSTQERDIVKARKLSKEWEKNNG